MKMNNYIKYVLSLVLIFSNLSYAFSMHYCQGKVEEIRINHFTNSSCKHHQVKSCCEVKTEQKHCKKSKKETKNKDNCCKDISYSDKVVEKQTVKIQSISPIQFIAAEVLHIQIPVVENEGKSQSNLLDFYVSSNAPPNYILYSQLTFYEG